ncbi:MAG: hypothetical protein Q8M66_07020, partial [Actinomycetota bacterium]|nr:hypothetical protein [Actinomycetota bacterium]
MHTSNSVTIVCARLQTARTVGALLALAVFAVTLSALVAPVMAGEQGTGGVVVLSEPRLPDGPLGWYRSPVTINLLPSSPGTVYFSWDDPFGMWEKAAGPIIAPEGKHILYSRLVSSESTASAMSLTSV